MSQGLGVLAVDERLLVTAWDPWLERATGIPETKARGRPLAELLPAIDKRGVRQRLERVISEGAVEVFSGSLHRDLFPREPAGHRRSTAAPLRREGRVVGLLLMIEEDSPDLDELRHEDWQVRRDAVARLARRGDADALEGLLRALQEGYRDLGVVSSALQVLGMLDLDLVEPLCRLARAPETDLRIYACSALGLHGDLRAAPCLLERLEDSDANVRFQAIEALGALRAPQAVPPLAALARSGDFFLAFPALDALALIGDARAAPELLPLLEAPPLRGPAARALGELGDASAAKPLAALLDGPDCESAALALARLHERCERLYGNGLEISEGAREQASPHRTRLAETARAARGKSSAALATVLGWLDGEPVDAALEAMLANPDARAAALKALVSRGRRAAESLRRRLPQEADLESRRDLIAALGRLGDAESVPALLDALTMDADTVILALEALAKIGDPRALDSMIKLLDHQSAAVRLASVAALSSLGRPELEGHTRRLLRDGTPRERQSAVKIAGYFGWAAAAEDVRRAALSDPDLDTRKAALEVLPFFERADAAAALEDALRDPEASVRAAAVRGLSHLPAEQAGPAVSRALADADLWVRYHAARAAEALRLQDAAAALARLATDDPAVPVRAAAAAAYGRAAGPAAAALLSRLAEDPSLDVASAALKALQEIREPSP